MRPWRQSAVRPARREDLAEIVRLEAACLPDPWGASSLAAEIDNPDSLVRVLQPAAAPGPTPGPTPGPDEAGPASTERTLVAYALFRLFVDEAELLRFGVDPAWRGQGLATTLLADGLHELTRLGIAACFLEVRVSNRAARALYHHFAFREVSRRRAYYPDGADALVLRRDLPAGASSSATTPPW